MGMTADQALAAVARAGQIMDYAFQMPKTKTWAIRLAPRMSYGTGATLAEAIEMALGPPIDLPALPPLPTRILWPPPSPDKADEPADNPWD